MKVWLVVALVLHCTFAFEHGDSHEERDSSEERFDPEEGMEPLIRCKRPFCDVFCPKGFKDDVKGCPTCECVATDPCLGHTCPRSSQVCLTKKCDYPCNKPEAMCIGESLCQHHQMRAEQKEQQEGPMCMKDGRFSPLQCGSNKVGQKECWCVNDRGEEMNYTRIEIQDEENDRPACLHIHTELTYVEFHLIHSIPDNEVNEHITKITKLVHETVSEWMMIDNDAIEAVTVEYHSTSHLLVSFYVRHSNKTTDVPSALHRLSSRMKSHNADIKYGDHVLTPHHKTLKMKPQDQLEDPWHHVAGCTIHNMYRRHRHAFIGGALVCSGLFIILIATIALVIRRARTIRRTRLAHENMQYKENLAFSNNLYDANQKLALYPEELKVAPQDEVKVDLSLEGDKAEC